MDKKELLEKLRNTATLVKKERIAISENTEALTYESMAEKLVSMVLSEESLIAAAMRGAMSISVLPLKKWISPLQLDPWQQAIFDEIRFQGFEPLVISASDFKGDSDADFYIGIQWKTM